MGPRVTLPGQIYSTTGRISSWSPGTGIEQDSAPNLISSCDEFVGCGRFRQNHARLLSLPVGSTRILTGVAMIALSTALLRRDFTLSLHREGNR
jgi:hypothetical protein